jgi:hypothetical protein
MASNGYEETLRDEIKNWDGVVLERGSSSKHNKVTLYAGTNKRFIHMSRGSARAAGRSQKNFRAELRRLLREIGATEL